MPPKAQGPGRTLCCCIRHHVSTDRLDHTCMLLRWCQTRLYGPALTNVLLPKNVPSAYSSKRFDLPDYLCMALPTVLQASRHHFCHTTFASMGGPAGCKRVYCMRKVDRGLKQSVRPRVLYIYCFSGSNAPRYHTLSVHHASAKSCNDIRSAVFCE